MDEELPAGLKPMTVESILANKELLWRLLDYELAVANM